MRSSITRAPARTRRPPDAGWIEDDTASTAVIAIAGIGTITLGGLLAWFVVGAFMMTMPGVIGIMGLVAVILAIGLTVMIFAPRSG